MPCPASEVNPKIIHLSENARARAQGQSGCFYPSALGILLKKTATHTFSC